MGERHFHFPGHSFSRLRQNRFDRIFECIHEGKNYNEIYEQLPPVIHRKRGREDNSKVLGDLAEQRAKEIIERHPYVRKFVLQDMPGHDGVADLDTQICPIPQIPVQVKSSYEAAARFFDSELYWKVAEEFGVPPVILNAGQEIIEKEEIYESFDSQLREILGLY